MRKIVIKNILKKNVYLVEFKQFNFFLELVRIEIYYKY
jgi:hypothetical protein